MYYLIAEDTYCVATLTLTRCRLVMHCRWHVVALCDAQGSRKRIARSTLLNWTSAVLLPDTQKNSKNYQTLLWHCIVVDAFA